MMMDERKVVTGMRIGRETKELEKTYPNVTQSTKNPT
jgi:hypothetical protein